MATHYESAGRGESNSGETFTFVVSKKARWGQSESHTRGSKSGSKAITALLVAAIALLTAGLVHLRDLSSARTLGIQADAAGRFARGQAVAGLKSAAAAKHASLTPAVWGRLIESRGATLHDSLRRSCAAAPAAHGNESAAESFYPEVRAALAAAHGPAAVPRMLSALAARKNREATALRALVVRPVRGAQQTGAAAAIPPTIWVKSALLLVALIGLAIPALPWALLIPLVLVSAIRALVFTLKSGRQEEATAEEAEALDPASVTLEPLPAQPVAPALSVAAAAPVPASAASPVSIPASSVSSVGAEELARLRTEREAVRTQLDGLHATMQDLKREVVAQQEAREAARAAEARLEELERRAAEAEARAEAATERATMAERRSRIARAERDDAMQTLHRAAAAAADAARAALHSHSAGRAAAASTAAAAATDKGGSHSTPSAFAVAAGANGASKGRKGGATSSPVEVVAPPTPH